MSSIDNNRRIQENFGHDPLAQEVIQKYYSVYQDNLLEMDQTVMDSIQKVTDRIKVGKEIGREWNRILFGKTPWDSSHRPIADIQKSELLKTALTAQFAFDKQLLMLKKLDRYLRLYYGKIDPELKLLQRSIQPENCFWIDPKNFTVKETAFLQGLKDKAAYFGRSFTEQVGQSIFLRKKALHVLANKILNVLQLSRQEQFWTEPKNAHQVLVHSKSLNRSPIEKYDVHPSLQNHYVLCDGDPILDPEKAKFIIMKAEGNVDLGQQLKQLNIKNFYGCFKPNQCIKTTSSDGSSVQISYENAHEALGVHEDRDLMMKTRRKEVKPGLFERVNVEVARFFSKKGEWTDNREATAAVDCHEAITLNRQMIALMLDGGMERLPQSKSQNLGEYFDALLQNDVAHLSGSYIDNPVFIEACEFQKFIHENQRKYYETGVITPYLEKGVQSEYVWKEARGDGGELARDLARVPILVQDIFNIYTSWSRNLSEFLSEIEKYKKTKEAIGDDLIIQLKAFKESLDEFIREAPSKEIGALIGKQTDWHAWRKSKSPEEIDQILEETLLGIQKGLKKFTPSLSQIGVPFSSKKKQAQIEATMSKNLPLLNLYNKAIPPIWQSKARFQALIQGELMKGTELSPLWLTMAETLGAADQELIKNEFIRSTLAKLQLRRRDSQENKPRR